MSIGSNASEVTGGGEGTGLAGLDDLNRCGGGGGGGGIIAVLGIGISSFRLDGSGGGGGGGSLSFIDEAAARKSASLL